MYIYSLCVSVLDAYGNRLDSHEICSGEDKNEILAERKEVRQQIREGEFDYLLNDSSAQKLRADIEVHDAETYSLLRLM